MKTKHLACAIALAASSLAAPLTAHSEDLIDIFEMALDNDPQLRAAKSTEQSTGEGIRQARANLLPQLSGTADYSDTQGDFTLLSGQTCQRILDFACALF